MAAFTYTVCGFFNFECAPQGGTSQTVDTVSEWPMFRFAYRRFADHEALVGNFTVGVSGRGAPRWFELRGSGSSWTLFQEGTYDPDTTAFRFMGSIAQDRIGSIALGYTATSASISPAILFATRLAGDPRRDAGVGIDLDRRRRLADRVEPLGGLLRHDDRSGRRVHLLVHQRVLHRGFRTAPGRRASALSACRECTGLFFDNFETGGTTRWSATAP